LLVMRCCLVASPGQEEKKPAIAQGFSVPRF